MSIIISHSHYLHVALVSFLAFQTSDRMIFGKLSFLEKGGTWWQYGAHKWYAMGKSLGTDLDLPTDFIDNNFRTRVRWKTC